MAFLIHKIQRSSNNVSFNHLVITKKTLNHFMYYLKKFNSDSTIFNANTTQQNQVSRTKLLYN